jgi:UDP-glucose 4-epimerase
MAFVKPSLLVTGVAGNLGTRLLPLLEGFNVIGVDLHPPSTPVPLVFETIDLGQESSCARLAQILLETRAVGVVHLAFVLDPLKMNILDRERMWRINVAGTARVLEAIAEANRMGGKVAKLVHLSSVAVYGPKPRRAALESDPLDAHTLTYAVHKREADMAVQSRVKDLGGCNVYLLRPHIFSGAAVQNYMIDCLRGTAYGRGRLGRRLADRGKRLPFIFPMGGNYLQHQVQLAHVDDVARLIAWALSRPKEKEPITILNVAGRGEPLTVAQAIQLTHASVKRLPTSILCRAVIRLMWRIGATSIPPDAFPYLIGSYPMDTGKLKKVLGNDYEQVIQYSTAAALLDAMKGVPQPSSKTQTA